MKDDFVEQGPRLILETDDRNSGRRPGRLECRWSDDPTRVKRCDGRSGDTVRDVRVHDPPWDWHRHPPHDHRRNDQK